MSNIRFEKGTNFVIWHEILQKAISDIEKKIAIDMGYVMSI